MKSYPSFEHIDQGTGEYCYTFNKYDGSNLRFEWSDKAGWYKFGTRTRLFDQTDDMFGPAISLFLNTLAEPILEICQKNLKKEKLKNLIVYVEFFGPSSFAGTHVLEEQKELKLIDLAINKKGLLDPDVFVDWFQNQSFTAELVYVGQLTSDFIHDIKNGKYNVIEGVVCKGGHKHKRWMYKIKTNSYKEKLQQVFGLNWKKVW